MKHLAVILSVLVLLGGVYYAGYCSGTANRQIEYITKQVEVIRYVEKQRAKIQALPNAGRDDLLKLMRANQF